MEQSVKQIESLVKKYSTGKHKPVLTVDEIPESVKYFPGVGRLFKNGRHYGQRKLLLSEAQFLTQHTNKYFVYAGAAPSNKGLLLAKLFPGVKMLFFDPRDFEIFINKNHDVWDGSEHPIIKKCQPADLDDLDSIIGDSHQLFLFNTHFTDDIADKLKVLGDDMSFMSDIRTKRNEKKAAAPVDIDILWNLAQQFTWSRLIGAAASCLKFRQIFYDQNQEDFERLAATEPYKSTFAKANQLGVDFISDYHAKRLVYPEGMSYLQAWPGQSSTETRLHILHNAKIIDHDLNDFEDKLHFYNCVYRTHANIVDYPEYLGADAKKCYDKSNDMALEVLIWKDYVDKFGGKVEDMITELSDYTKTLCDEGSQPTSLKNAKNSKKTPKTGGDGGGSGSNTEGIRILVVVVVILILIVIILLSNIFSNFSLISTSNFMNRSGSNFNSTIRYTQ